MIRLVLLVIGIALAALVTLASMKPDQFSVERSIHIEAQPSQVFPLINDLREWDNWSPWAKKDPNMSKSFSGATTGLGAIYEWDGNNDVGAGRMEIVDTSPGSRVNIRLNFTRPYEAQNDVEFALNGDGDFTETTWRVSGPMSFVSKLISVFVSMDQMIGPDFEQGLSDLKALAEQGRG